MRVLAFGLAALCALTPPAVRAQTMQRVSGQRIAAAASREIAAIAHDADHAFVPVALVPDQLVGGGAVELRAQTPVGGAGFASVPIEIDVDGRLNRTIYVGYRLQQYVETAVATHDLVPGTVLSAQDVTMARVPYTGRAPNGTGVLVGRRVENAILKDQPITIEATVVNQIVKAGSTIMFIVLDSGVAVAADAIARTGGGLGDQVFVFNPLTRKALSGTVTGPGTVELDISGGDAQ